MKKIRYSKALVALVAASLVVASLTGCGKGDADSNVSSDGNSVESSADGEQGDGSGESVDDVSTEKEVITDPNELPDLSTIEFPADTPDTLPAKMRNMATVVEGSDYFNKYLGDGIQSKTVSYFKDDVLDNTYYKEEIETVRYPVIKGVEGIMSRDGMSKNDLLMLDMSSLDYVEISTTTLGGYTYKLNLTVSYINYDDEFMNDSEDMDDYLITQLFDEQINSVLKNAYFNQQQSYAFDGSSMMISKVGEVDDTNSSKYTTYEILLIPENGPETLASIVNETEAKQGIDIAKMSHGYATDEESLRANLFEDLDVQVDNFGLRLYSQSVDNNPYDDYESVSFDMLGLDNSYVTIDNYSLDIYANYTDSFETSVRLAQNIIRRLTNINPDIQLSEDNTANGIVGDKYFALSVAPTLEVESETDDAEGETYYYSMHIVITEAGDVSDAEVEVPAAPEATESPEEEDGEDITESSETETSEANGTADGAAGTISDDNTGLDSSEAGSAEQ